MITADFVVGCRERGCTPHVSQNYTNRRSAIDARTRLAHPGYRISTIKRKRIEEPFGWMKTVGGLRKTRHRGRGLVEWFFVLTATAHNLIRTPKILAATENGTLVWSVKMRQKDSRSCACCAVDHPFVLSPPSQASGNSVTKWRFIQQPVSVRVDRRIFETLLQLHQVRSWHIASHRTHPVGVCLLGVKRTAMLRRGNAGK